VEDRNRYLAGSDCTPAIVGSSMAALMILLLARNAFGTPPSSSIGHFLRYNILDVIAPILILVRVIPQPLFAGDAQRSIPCTCYLGELDSPWRDTMAKREAIVTRTLTVITHTSHDRSCHSASTDRFSGAHRGRFLSRSPESPTLLRLTFGALRSGDVPFTFRRDACGRVVQLIHRVLDHDARLRDCRQCTCPSCGVCRLDERRRRNRAGCDGRG
jgi:hypothetical protein